LRSDEREEESARAGKQSNRAELIEDAGGCYSVGSAFFSPCAYEDKRAKEA
jgi:hypothetical protein